MKKFLSAAAAALSGLLLFLSFAPFEISYLGWMALIPVILACAGAPLRRAAVLGGITGGTFFLLSLFWLHHVSWLGFMAIALYSGLYLIPFTVFVALRDDGWRSLRIGKNMCWMLGGSAVWTASEYVRSILFTGFPWNPLGVSQYLQGSLIQIAEWGGVYLVSFLMVFVGLACAVTLLQYAAGLRKRGYKLHLEFMAALFLMAAASSFGFRVLLSGEVEDRPVRVGLIQPNIPEVGNWEMADPELIYQRLENLTDYARRIPDLDLMIWPETALPDCVRYSPRSSDLVQRMVAHGVPLLVGSMDYTWNIGSSPDFFNSSMLFDTSGELLATYHKQHLVLFGEYIPFDESLPFISALTPIESSFRSGSETVLMNLPDDPRPFSVLICFEDTLPYLARRAAQAGATWMVNQTNDSWFDPSSGSQQHLAHAVFRCIETRLPMVRCANTGVSCSINAKGEILGRLARRKVEFSAVAVQPADRARPLTFYIRYGDLFAQACLLSSIAVFIGAAIQREKTRHA